MEKNGFRFDWSGILNVIDVEEEDAKKLKDSEIHLLFLDYPYLVTEKSTHNKIKAIIQDNIFDQVRLNYRKIVRRPCDLRGKDKLMYEHITENIAKTDKEILNILELIKTIDNSKSKNKRKISGRLMDTLCTRFSKYFDSFYYIDVTHTSNPRIVGFAEDTVDRPKGKNIILFDLCESYKRQMSRFSKTYFDIFSRSSIVEHPLASGKNETVDISLCQVIFFAWAKKFCVFEFLHAKYQEVINVRKESSNYTPKKKRKRAAPTRRTKTSSALCPPISFAAQGQGGKEKRRKKETVEVVFFGRAKN